MASYEGGMEIEQLAVERPDALARVPVDAVHGVDEAKAREIATAAKFPEDLIAPVADVLVKLWQTFVAEEKRVNAKHLVELIGNRVVFRESLHIVLDLGLLDPWHG